MSNDAKPDMWDDAGPFWYRELPADTIEAFVSGEGRDLMKIEKDGATYWLSETGQMGAGSYPTLEAAKAAGDETIDELYEKQFLTLTVDADLDPAEWKFCHQEDHVWFECVNDMATHLVREGEGKWAVEVNDEAINSGFDSPKEAAVFVAQRKAFSPTI